MSNESFDKLNYESTTGVFTWANPSAKKLKIGDFAGSLRKNGYLQIGYMGKLYFAHRLAWYMTYGKWPCGQIDHINGIKTDNRIENLRDVHIGINMENQKTPHKDSKSGLLGVSWYKPTKKWLSQIQIKGKKKYLGYFDTAENAHKAYLTAKRKLHKGCTI